jgi:hypothetical protein
MNLPTHTQDATPTERKLAVLDICAEIHDCGCCGTPYTADEGGCPDCGPEFDCELHLLGAADEVGELETEPSLARELARIALDGSLAAVALA